MNNRNRLLTGLVLGSFLFIPVSSYSSDDVTEAVKADAAEVASEAADDAADAAGEATDEAAEVADDAEDAAADAKDAEADATTDADDRYDRCESVSSNLPEGHPCYIPPR